MFFSKVPAYLNVVDIAGLVKGAHEGHGLGNAFLSHIKACDAIFHMLSKCFLSNFLFSFQDFTFVTVWDKYTVENILGLFNSWATILLDYEKRGCL